MRGRSLVVILSFVRSPVHAIESAFILQSSFATPRSGCQSRALVEHENVLEHHDDHKGDRIECKDKVAVQQRVHLLASEKDHRKLHEKDGDDLCGVRLRIVGGRQARTRKQGSPESVLDSTGAARHHPSLLRIDLQKLRLRKPSGGTGEAQQVGLAPERRTHPFKLLKVDQEHEDSEAEGVVHDCRALELAERDRDRRLGLLERKAVRREQL